jgi:hypothetical protein
MIYVIYPVLILADCVQFESCELLVWDDELDEVEAANGKQREGSCRNCQLMMEFGAKVGNKMCKDMGKKMSQVVMVGIIMCLIMAAMLLKM